MFHIKIVSVVLLPGVHYVMCCCKNTRSLKNTRAGDGVGVWWGGKNEAVQTECS